MVAELSEWNVLPHGPLEQLAENLWRVEGALPKMSLKRNMLVARRADGLVIHNAIALNNAVYQEFAALGEPKYLLVPNGMHRLDAGAFKARFPELLVFTPRGSFKKAQERVPVDGVYEDFPHDEAVWLEELPGVGGQEGAMWVRSSDGLSLILNDAVFNMDKKADLLGYLFTTVLGSAPGPRVSRLAKLLLVKNQPALRSALLRYAENPELVRLAVAHEKVAHGAEASEALRQAASYLKPA